MIRKFALAGTAAAALTFGALAAPANAQDTTPTPTPPVCTNVGYNNCIAYPEGGFAGGATPTATPRPQATATPVVSADDATATSSDTTGGQAIAFTGSESRVLGYAGAGLIGFGAIALIAARRREDADADQD